MNCYYKQTDKSKGFKSLADLFQSDLLNLV